MRISRNCYYNIARALVLSNSVCVSVLKISIVLADSVCIAWANRFARFFFFARAAVLCEGENIIFRDNNWYKQRLCHRFQNEDSFCDLFSWARVLKWGRKREKQRKGDSASVPSRFASLNNHFWYCCLFSRRICICNRTTCCPIWK